MNKDRIDCSGERIMRENDVHEEATLFFAPLATPDAPALANARRVLQLVDGTPFVLPPRAVLVSLRVVPYPADRTSVYTGDMLGATRIGLGTPTIEMKRNTDTTTALAGADNPIKIFAQTEPGGAPDTIGMVTDKLVLTLTMAAIGAGTQLSVHGEGATLTNAAGETDASVGGMTRTQSIVYPHGTTAILSDAVLNAPTCLVGIVGATLVKYDLAVVVHYRMTRAEYYLVKEPFPPNMREEVPAQNNNKKKKNI